jgi:type IV pilus assembly protein PilC
VTVYRYTARPIAGGPSSTGELSGETEAEVRASLRRIGLQPLRIDSARAKGSRSNSRWSWIGVRIDSHLRTRRRMQRADLFDSLATMLESGLPLVEAARTLVASSRGRQRIMLRELLDGLEGGRSFSDSMALFPAWFDTAECAMARAGEQSGELAMVLSSLSQRHQRSGDLAGRIASALTYPAIVGLVGVGVTVFLSTKTLPELVSILEQAGVSPPSLTAVVMAIGQFIARWWWVVLVGALAVPLGVGSAFRRANDRGIRPPLAGLWPPLVLRQALMAHALLTMAEMLRCGVTLVDAIRATGPTLSGPGAGELGQRTLALAADEIEKGHAVGAAFDDPKWFDAEVRQLIAVGDASGELDRALTRLGQRLHRRAQHAIDRLTALLEPVVIILLATLVGIVVLSAVLPLIRLQEVL